ncbi:MAG: hypothetical protein FJ271_10465 [Planctomycetes bacterium]|nr:hypothetical protein [Planctomycetota bacterium]
MSDVLGVAAFLAAGAGLLCTSSRSWAGLVLPVSAGAVMLGLLALLCAMSRGQRAHLAALGTATAVAATIFAWLFPALLGQAYWMFRQSAPVISMEIRAVPLTASHSQGTAAGEDWVNAAKSAIQQGPLRIWIGSVRLIRLAPAEDEAPRKVESRGDAVVIRVRMQLVEDARRFAGHQAQPQTSRGDDLQPRLLDSTGRSLPRREATLATLADNTIRSSMFPVTVEDRVFAFALESAGNQDLRLEIPAGPLGGQGTYRFTIPASLMRHDTGGDLRHAPAPGR